MPSGKLLRQLIKAGAEGDEGAFRVASEAVIREEREKQHHLLASDLERILYGGTSAPDRSLSDLAGRVPTDEERGLPLLEVRHPGRGLDDVVLTDRNRDVLADLVEEHRRVDFLRSWGLQPSTKLLFCGPPGCGKSLTAEALAFELSRPLVVVRLDSVVSSWLGATSANLRKVFDFVESHEVVALLDEFDGVGKERSDASEHGELKRVVNAVLQILDGYRGSSLIIAATNHDDLLDSALWRRFDETLFFPGPDDEALRRLLILKLRGVRRDFDIEDRAVLKTFAGRSHAELERILRRAIKAMALRGEEFLERRHLEAAALRELSSARRDP